MVFLDICTQKMRQLSNVRLVFFDSFGLDSLIVLDNELLFSYQNQLLFDFIN